MTELPLLEVADREELRAWLARNATTSTGVRLAVGKKDGTATHLTYDDAVEEALSFGWIDSTAGRLDDDRYTITFTPRKPRSGWSRSNKARVEQLVAQGRMAPPGLAAIEAAKASGAWTALDEVEDLVVPEDLAAALAQNPAADAFWRTLGPSARKIALFRIASAKRPETRARRIAETVAEAAEGRARNRP